MNESRVPLLLAILALIVAAIAWYQSTVALQDVRGVGKAETTDTGGRADDRRGLSIPLAGAPTQGAANAKVALVEFSDYECPYCIRHFKQTMPRLAESYVKTGKILYVFRDYPVDQLHPESIRAHEAAHCAGEQNRYWEMHPRLFGPAGSHTSDRLLGLARDVGLDMDAFGRCVESRRSDEPIRETSRMAVDMGANGTPTFFVGLRDPDKDAVVVLQRLIGAQPYEVFESAIESALARAR